jgi:CHAT domain-containing protein
MELASVAQNRNSAQSEEILRHAASCDRCGAILHEALSADLEPNGGEAKPTASRLRTVSADWQRTMAQRLVKAGQQSIPEQRRSHWKHWMAAAACLAAVASAILWQSYRSANDPKNLLAMAYTATRPFEYRIPDAGYSPVRQRRAGSRSAFDRPESLVEAEVRIRRGLIQSPGDARLLLLKGRAELIESQYDSAVEDLRHASEISSSSEVLVDLGAALALRESAAQKPNYGESIDDFLRALQSDQRNVSALFNLAITYEKVGMLDDSIATWNKLLGIEKRAEWIEEARRRLGQVELRKKAKKAALDGVFDDPKALVAAARTGAPFEAEYLQSAFWSRWLPEAQRDSAANEAARILANVWADRFGDNSLRDAYRQTGVSTSALLADAGSVILDNTYGHNDQVLARAENLAQRLEAAGQRVAALRTQLELAYSYRRSERHEPCLAITNRLLGQLNETTYWWLAGRTHLEHSICLGRAGGMGPARQERQIAEARLTAHGILGLALQAQELVTSIDALSGNSAAVWQASPQALARYWTSAAADAQAQQVFYDMSIAAKSLGWKQAAVATQEAAVAAASRWGNAQVEALNRVYLASLLQEARSNERALVELGRANSLFAALPQGVTVANLMLAGQLRRAEAEAAGPEPGRAIADLDELTRLPNFSSLEVRMRAKQARGIAFGAQGDWREAERCFLEAARLASEHARSFTQPLSRLAAAEMALDSRRNLVQIALLNSRNPAEALRRWEMRSPESAWDEGTPEPGRELASGLVITYVSVPAGVAAFAEYGQAIEGRLLTVRPSALDAEIEQFRRLCASPASSLAELRATGNLLYAQLLKPFSHEMLNARRILIEPDAFVSSLPFGALIDDGGHYVAERMAVGVLADHGDLRGHDPALMPEVRALIVSAPSGGNGDFPFLHGAVVESRKLAAKMPRSTVVEASALASDALARQMASSEVLHFAGHGWSNGGNGALILGPDPDGGFRYLTATDLARESWKECRLAVLSACLTAAGVERGPVNPQSLVRGLLAAGARRVMASRWSIDSESTPPLMERFYDGVFAGMTPTAALQEASQQIRNTPGWEHPYYWAAFDIFGAP